MLAGTALYVHLMVYMGLSLFIIRRALRIYGCMRIYAYNLTEQQIKYNMFVKPNQDLGETHLFASNKYKVCDTFSLAPINKFFLLT